MHAALRERTAAAFTAERLDQLEPTIARIVDESFGPGTVDASRSFRIDPGSVVERRASSYLRGYRRAELVVSRVTDR